MTLHVLFTSRRTNRKTGQGAWQHTGKTRKSPLALRGLLSAHDHMARVMIATDVEPIPARACLQGPPASCGHILVEVSLFLDDIFPVIREQGSVSPLRHGHWMLCTGKLQAALLR